MAIRVHYFNKKTESPYIYAAVSVHSRALRKRRITSFFMRVRFVPFWASRPSFAGGQKTRSNARYQRWKTQSCPSKTTDYPLFYASSVCSVLRHINKADFPVNW